MKELGSSGCFISIYTTYLDWCNISMLEEEGIHNTLVEKKLARFHTLVIYLFRHFVQMKTKSDQ